jgi:uncharacterized protein (TIGR03032 family)
MWSEEVVREDAERTAIEFEYSPNVVRILSGLNVSLWISTYEAGQIVSLGTRAQELQLAFRRFDQPMGISSAEDRLAIGESSAIQIFEKRRGAARPQAVFRKTRTISTGKVMGHDLVLENERLWLVNTLCSSICAVDEGMIVDTWKPSFVSEITPEDRCHLNGMAVSNGSPSYVTALAETNTANGWREHRISGGCLIDVRQNVTILSGLCMPHSPRIHQGRLWLLNSGRGEFGYVDLKRGRFEPIEVMPGYTRGLAFAGDYAFVGLSKIRQSNIFGGLPIASHPEGLHCGVGIVDLRAGKTVAVFQFHTGITEIFAIETIVGTPMISFEKSNETL